MKTSLEPQDKIKYLKDNLKYWLLGSIISVILGLAIVFSMYFLDKYIVKILKMIVRNLWAPFIYEMIWYFTFLFGAFVGAITIKLIKKDFPWYFYSTVGIIYILILPLVLAIIFPSFSILLNSTITIALKQIYAIFRDSPYLYHTGLSRIYTLLVGAPISSLLGGGIVVIYRYIKNRQTAQEAA